MLRALVGDALGPRRCKILPPPRLRSVGFASSEPSDHGCVLHDTALMASGARPLPFLLSLLRSRIPFALRFRTAGVRVKTPPDKSRESRRKSLENELVTEVVEAGMSLLAGYRATFLVSIWRGLSIKVRSVLLFGLATSSSTQPAGVGGTVSRVDPLPGGGRRVREVVPKELLVE